VQTQDSGSDPRRPPGVADLPDRVRELLPDGVVDELLAGAHGEEDSSAIAATLSDHRRVAAHLEGCPAAPPSLLAAQGRDVGTTPDVLVARGDEVSSWYGALR
jgi:hypothetical protein